MKFSACLLICAVMTTCSFLTARQPKTKARTSAPPVVYHPVFPTNLDPELFENPEAAKSLIGEREAVINKLFDERRKIIKTDRRAKELHRRIMQLNKELAVLMENKRAVRELNRELRAIDNKIKALKLQKKDKDQKNVKQGNKK